MAGRVKNFTFAHTIMKISFIITYYNEPPGLLRRCADSILALPLDEGEREIIVIDDGSETPVEEDLTARGIRYIRQENGGLSRARNRGLGAAQGDYVQFVDADDALIPATYGLIIEALRRHSPDMIMFRFSRNDEGNAMPRDISMRQTDGITYLRRHNVWGSACCYVFRRSILDGLRFKPGILHEDELFTPQLLMRAGKLLYTAAAAYLYRRRECTIMHSHDSAHTARRLKDALHVMAELKTISDAMGDDPPLQRRVSQLAMDHIYNVWSLTHSLGEVRRGLTALHGIGLFPLPLKTYTAKYIVFAIVSRPAALLVT